MDDSKVETKGLTDGFNELLVCRFVSSVPLVTNGVVSFAKLDFKNVDSVDDIVEGGF